MVATAIKAGKCPPDRVEDLRIRVVLILVLRDREETPVTLERLLDGLDRAGSDCRLEPVVKTSRMIREHLWRIVNAIILRATNRPAEGRTPPRSRPRKERPPESQSLSV